MAAARPTPAPAMSTGRGHPAAPLACAAQRYEVAAPEEWAKSIGGNLSELASSLSREQLKRFSTSAEHVAVEKAVPFQTAMTEQQLAWEYAETRSFQHKQLKIDPRLKPSDIEVTYSHLSQCTECEGRAKAKMALHGPKPPRGPRTFDAFTGWQFLVDDYAIDRWTNVLRVLNKPTDKRVALRPEANSSAAARFGCPCSVVRRSRDRGFRLYHAAASTAGSNHRYPEWCAPPPPSPPPHSPPPHLLSTFFTSLLRHIRHQAIRVQL